MPSSPPAAPSGHPLLSSKKFLKHPPDGALTTNMNRPCTRSDIADQFEPDARTTHTDSARSPPEATTDPGYGTMSRISGWIHETANSLVDTVMATRDLSQRLHSLLLIEHKLKHPGRANTFVAMCIAN